MEEVKEILLLYKKKYKELEKMRGKIHDIEESTTPAINFDLPRTKAYSTSPTEKTAVALADMKSTYIYKSACTELMRQKTCNLIDKMQSTTNKELLYTRYMLLLSWKDIIKRLDTLRPGKGYDLKAVIGYKHKEALKEFQTILNTTPDKRKDEIYDLARN